VFMSQHTIHTQPGNLHSVLASLPACIESHTQPGVGTYGLLLSFLSMHLALLMCGFLGSQKHLEAFQSHYRHLPQFFLLSFWLADSVPDVTHLFR
jgi:hypothetical protein